MSKKLKIKLSIILVIILLSFSIIYLIVGKISGLLEWLFPQAIDTEFISMERVWEGLDKSYYTAGYNSGADGRWWYITDENGKEEWVAMQKMGVDSTGYSQLQKTLLVSGFTKQNLMYFHDLYYDNNIARYFSEERYADFVNLNGINNGLGKKFKNPYSHPAAISCSSQLIGEYICPKSYSGEISENFDSLALSQLQNLSLNLDIPAGYIKKYMKLPISVTNNIGLENLDRVGELSISDRLDSESAIRVENAGTDNTLYLTQNLVSDYSVIKDYNFPWQGLYVLYLMSDYHEELFSDVEELTIDEVEKKINEREHPESVSKEETDSLPSRNVLLYDIDEELTEHTDDEKKEFIEKLTNSFIPQVLFRSHLDDQSILSKYTSISENKYRFDYQDEYAYPTQNCCLLNSKYSLTDSAGNLISGQSGFRYLFYNLPTSVISRADCWYGTYEFEFDEAAHTIKSVKKTIDISQFQKKCEELLSVVVKGDYADGVHTNDRDTTICEFDMDTYLEYLDSVNGSEQSGEKVQNFRDNLAYYYSISQKEAYYEEKDYFGTISLGTDAATPATDPQNPNPGTADPLTGYINPETDSTNTRNYVFSRLSDETIHSVTNAVTNGDIARNVVYYALTRVGFPYSNAYRANGYYYDCSSLVYYAYKTMGITFGSNSYPPTAASEAKYCVDNGMTVSGTANLQPGDLLFYGGGYNARFMNIYHVAIYVGNGMIVEASDVPVGVIYRPIYTSNLVLIGRPR